MGTARGASPFSSVSKSRLNGEIRNEKCEMVVRRKNMEAPRSIK